MRLYTGFLYKKQLYKDLHVQVQNIYGASTTKGKISKELSISNIVVTANNQELRSQFR